MSDEFDKNDDDMSWLDDFDDESGDGTNDDDLEFDWDGDDDDTADGEARRGTGSLGFTGDLNWRQDEASEGDDGSPAAGDDDSFDWQTTDDDEGNNLGGDPSKLGFTGMLSWRQDADDADEGDERTDDPIDFSFLDDADVDDFDLAGGDAPQPYDPFAEMSDADILRQSRTGLTDAMGDDADDDFDDEDDVDLSFLDDIGSDDEGGRVSTGFTGALDDNDADFSFLDEIDAAAQPYDPFAEMSDADILRQSRTGLTDAMGDDADDDDFDDDDDDLSFLDDIGADELEADRVRTGFTDELSGDEADLSFLDDIDDESEDEAAPPYNPFAQVSDEDDVDLSFLDDVGSDNEGGRVSTGFTGALADGDVDFSFMDDLPADEANDAVQPYDPFAEMSDADILQQSRTGLTDAMSDDDDDDDLSFLGDFDGDDSESEAEQAAPYDEFGGLSDEEMLRLTRTGLTSAVNEAEADDEADEEDDSAAVDAFLAGLMGGGEQDEPEAADPFAFDQAQAGSMLADDDLFAGISDDDLLDDEPQPEPDFEPEPQPDPEPQRQYQDLDDLLSTFDDEIDLSQQMTLESGELAFEDALDDDDDAFLVPSDDDDMPMRPDFLTGVSVGDASAGTSATAYVRQMENRPEDDLDERLYAFRQRGQKLSRRTPPDPDMEAILPGVVDTLGAPQIRLESERISEGVQLSDEQARELELLQGLVASDERALRRASLGDDELLSSDPLDTQALPKQAAPRRSRRRRIGRREVPLGRILAAVLVLAAVIAPFFGFFLFGDEPPAQFTGGGQAAVFENIGTIAPRDYVLFAVEYGPTNAAELDPILEAMVKHTIAQGGLPVLVGRNPVGISRAEDLMTGIVTDADFVQAIGGPDLAFNEDYYIIGFQPGGEAALAELASNTETVLASNIRGNPTLLDLASLDAFALIALLAGTPSDVQAYAEQIAPRTSTPLVAGVGEVSADVARQYLNAPDGLDGLLVSLPDAATYEQLLNDRVLMNAVDVANLPPATRPFTPTPLISATPSGTPTLTPIGFVASATPEGFVPTDVPAGFEPFQRFGVGAFVTSRGGAINARSGPGTQFDVVGTLGSNEAVIVQGEAENEVGDIWTLVLLPDGTEGYVLSDLIVPAEGDLIPAAQTQIAEIEAVNRVGGVASAPTATPLPATIEPIAPDGAGVDVEAIAAALDQVGTIIVIGDGPVDVFPAPLADADPIATANPGDELPVLGVAFTDEAVENVFIEVQLNADGESGFIYVLDVEIPGFGRVDLSSGVPSMVQEDPDTVESMVQAATDTPMPTATIPPTETDVPTATDVATEAATATATATPTEEEEPTATPTPSATATPTPTPDPALVLDEGSVVLTSSRTSINVRRGPGTEFERIVVLRPNTRLLVIGLAAGERWVEVNLPGGGTGFIFRDLVRVDPDGTLPTPAPTATDVQPTQPPTDTPTATPTITPIPLDAEGLVAQITARRSVNVRSGPSRGFQPIGPLNPGEVVNVLGATEDENWLEVQLPDGRTGFIIADAAEVVLGATYFEQATATALAGGQARIVPQPQNTAPAVIATLSGDVPGRIPLGGGSTMTVRGLQTVNVREAPSITAQVVGQLPGRAEVPASVLSADEQWALVQLPGGVEGWLSRRVAILELVPFDSPPTLTPIPTQTGQPTRTPTLMPTATTTPIGVEAERETERETEESSVEREGDDTGVEREILPTFTPTPTEAGVALNQPRRMSRPDRRQYRPHRQDGTTGEIVADGLANVRGGPGITFSVVGTVEPGTVVDVLGASDDGAWIEIVLPDGPEGFISSQLIVIGGDVPAADNAEDVPTDGTGEIIGAGPVDLFSGAGADFDVIGQAEPGTAVVVVRLELDDDGQTWALVELDDDTIGFVRTGDVLVTEFPGGQDLIPTTTPSATPTDTPEPTDTAAPVNVTQPSVQDAPTRTPDPNATATPTVTATRTATDTPTEQPTNTPPPTADDNAATEAVTQEAAVDGEGSGEITEENVIVRDGPGPNFDAIATLNPPDVVGVRGFTVLPSDETWVRVRLDDDTAGYVPAAAIRVTAFPTVDEPFAGDGAATPTNAAELTLQDGEGSANVTGDGAVDVLAGPGADFDVIGTVAAGGALPVRGLQVSDTGETWVRVRLEGGGIGYINASNLTVTAFPGINEPFAGVDGTVVAQAAVTEDAAVVITAEATEDLATADVTEAGVGAGTAVARANTSRVGPFTIEQGGEFNNSLVRREYAVRLGLIVAALVIFVFGLGNALFSRRSKSR
jgi:uncharacterized protein YgiM (DUF1202 family)